jgi:hypothetical protein
MDKIQRKIKKRAKLDGRDWLDILLDFVSGHTWVDNTKVSIKLEPRERLAAIRLLTEVSLVKTSEQNVNVNKTEGPSIGLPPARQDPAKLISIEGKKASNE